jgi:hypothetical protein
MAQLVMKMKRLVCELRRFVAGNLAIAALKMTPKTDVKTLLAFVALLDAMAAEQ